MGAALGKRAIRALGVAESYRRGGLGERAVLAGVVMRSDLIIDGVAMGYATVGGDDATEAVVRLYRGLARNDINFLLLGGAIISYYNIIDVDRVAEACGRPVVALSYRPTRGIEEAIKRRFPQAWERKVELYRALGRRRRVPLKTGKAVYVRASGLSEASIKPLLDKFVLQGGVPEPVRVARLVARAFFRGLTP
ncbi:MAG: DUF99 domain-containing protein [Nitrososphaerota archaeon]